jgi:hypothetical protein
LAVTRSSLPSVRPDHKTSGMFSTARTFSVTSRPMAITIGAPSTSTATLENSMSELDPSFATTFTGSRVMRPTSPSSSTWSSS